MEDSVAISLAVMVAALAGCAGQQPLQAALGPSSPIAVDQAFAPLQQACAPSGTLQPGNYAAYAQCDGEAKGRELVAHGLQHEMVAPYLAVRERVAAKIDRGELTPEQGQEQMAQEQERLVASQEGKPVPIEQPRPMIVAMPYPVAPFTPPPPPQPQPTQPLYMPPPQQPQIPTMNTTNCMMMGNMLNCQSF